MTVIKFKRNIYKDYCPRTLPRKSFFAQNLFAFIFLSSLIYRDCCPTHWSQVSSPLFINSLCWSLWALILLLFGLRNQNVPLQLASFVGILELWWDQRLVMVGSGPNLEESVSSQHQDQFFNLKQRKDWEVSVHTTHTNRSQSRSGSHISHGENTRNM